MSGYFFTKKAVADLYEIQDHISCDRPFAAIRWAARLKERCERLALNPGWGRRRDDLRPGLQSLSFGRYILFYRQSAKGIEIVRVLHMARDLRPLLPDSNEN